ncbi:MAG: hypothetical protein UHD09_07975 [Bifidobacterium sp.]|nr:hypothetical protein [Bifidobacterium sp.]
MRDAFTLDSARFQDDLGHLQRRFERLVAAAPLSFDAIDDDERNPVIVPGQPGQPGHAAQGAHRARRRTTADAAVRPGDVDAELARMVEDLFGATCWAALVATASLCAEPALAGAARAFLMDTAVAVRRKGLAGWLYELLNDATMALVLDEPSAAMPVTIRPMGGARMARWLRAAGRSRYGTPRRQQEDMAEYVRQTHRLAAFTMLRYGSPTGTAGDIAATLLTDPGLGVCMLRADAGVRALAATTDTRYRRVVDYLRRVRVDADLAYARAVGRGEAQLDDSDRSELTYDIDRRYLYDARMLVDAYRELWDADVQPAADLVARLEATREEPDARLWDNPVYLRDLASSLMGASAASDLVDGFEARDRVRFGRGVERLESYCERVRRFNVLMLPVELLDDAQPDWEALLRAGYLERTREWRRYADLADDVASVVLARLRLGDDALRVRAAVRVLQQSVCGYCDVILPPIEREIERLGELEEAEGGRGAVSVGVAA